MARQFPVQKVMKIGSELTADPRNSVTLFDKLNVNLTIKKGLN